MELPVGGGISLWFVAIEGYLNCCVFGKMIEMYVAIWFDLFNLVDNLYLPSQLTVKRIFG